MSYEARRDIMEEATKLINRLKVMVLAMLIGIGFMFLVSWGGEFKIDHLAMGSVFCLLSLPVAFVNRHMGKISAIVALAIIGNVLIRLIEQIEGYPNSEVTFAWVVIGLALIEFIAVIVFYIIKTRNLRNY